MSFFVNVLLQRFGALLALFVDDLLCLQSERSFLIVSFAIVTKEAIKKRL